MAVPSDKKAFAEWVRLRRIRKEQLEKVAEIRASIGRFRPRTEATSVRMFNYVLWLLVTWYVVSLVVDIFGPLIDADFSNDAIRQAAMTIILIVGMIIIVNPYDSTPVNHLPPARRAAVNCLLCIGGLIFIASCMLLGMAYYVSSILGMGGTVLVLQFAKKIALAN